MRPSIFMSERSYLVRFECSVAVSAAAVRKENESDTKQFDIVPRHANSIREKLYKMDSGYLLFRNISDNPCR